MPSISYYKTNVLTYSQWKTSLHFRDAQGRENLYGQHVEGPSVITSMQLEAHICTEFRGKPKNCFVAHWREIFCPIEHRVSWNEKVPRDPRIQL